MQNEPIILERQIAAPPEVVYTYLTDENKWPMWQGIHASLDPRPGGIFALSMANGMRARGQFVELVPAERVVFTWGWIDHPGVPPGSSTVEISLAPVDDGTLLTLRHSGLPSDDVPPHTAGWEMYLPQLAIVAAGGDPGADLGPMAG
jgi:uncharacterized protein YndB with AHSA1/START domain